jgi:hypothetical protein
VIWAGFVGVLGFGVWEVRHAVREHEQALAQRDEHIATLEQDIEEAGDLIAELQLALQFVKVDHRLATLEVLSQERQADDPNGWWTVVRFQEIDAAGLPMGKSQTFELEGRYAYVDALVIKFDDSYVERGDVWRGTSICLFRRLFGEHQEPGQGFPLDTSGKRPTPYASDRDEGAERDLWARFWDYANDPDLAAQAGVRAVHGEAPYVQLRPGGRYLIELRANGGLSIRQH